MNLAGLTKAYALSPLKVRPSALLLDPMNPRLLTESAQHRSYSHRDIQSPILQKYVLELVCSREHGVKRLIESIEEMGFIGGLHEIIVKAIGKGGPYLVIEGNRRTAALQHLLAVGQTLRPEVLKSIELIEVKEFVYHDNSECPESTVIDVLLGSIHIDGPKEWGALEKAHYVHRSYVRALGERKRFRYDVEVARKAGASFKMSPQAVNKCLKVCRVYEQLRKAQVGVEPKHYTLIDLATKTRAVAQPYFELDSELCEFSLIGLERFIELVLRENAPIHNPKLFDSFVEVFEYGSALELRAAAEGEVSLEDTQSAISRRRARREFREELQSIKRTISELYVGGYQGTEGEKNLIIRIKELVDTRLVPLIESERQRSLV